MPQLTPGTLGCGEPKHIRPKCPNVRMLEGCHPLNIQRHYFWQERYRVTKFEFQQDTDFTYRMMTKELRSKDTKKHAYIYSQRETSRTFCAA